MKKRTILLTGAFERDNFGDLLYPLLVSKFLGGDAEPVLAAHAPSSTDHLLGQTVQPLCEVLDAQRFDAIVLVGGQSIPLSLAAAKQMNPLSPSAGDTDTFYPAYLPILSECRMNADTPLFVNSVGVDPLRPQPVRLRRAVLRELRAAESVTVRESFSLRTMQDTGVRASVHPDSVHAWSLFMGDSVPSSSVVVQLSQEVLGRFGRQLVTALADAIGPRSWVHDREIVLVAAGVAPGHDSIAELEAVANQLRNLLPTRSVIVDLNRNPREIAAIIGGADLFIGHSLHGRIVSASYDVPRVSLWRPKTERYANEWDAAMPSAVEPEALAAAVALAGTVSTMDAAKLEAESARAEALLSLQQLRRNVLQASAVREETGVKRRRIANEMNSVPVLMSDGAVSASRRLSLAIRRIWALRGTIRRPPRILR